MTTLKVRIALGNAAMLEPADLERALEQTALMVGACHTARAGEMGSVRDDNGNRVGDWRIVEGDTVLDADALTRLSAALDSYRDAVAKRAFWEDNGHRGDGNLESAKERERITRREIKRAILGA